MELYTVSLDGGFLFGLKNLGSGLTSSGFRGKKVLRFGFDCNRLFVHYSSWILLIGFWLIRALNGIFGN